MASGKESVVKVTNSEEKKKALDAAIAKLEKDFGKGAVMKLGESGAHVCSRDGSDWMPESGSCTGTGGSAKRKSDRGLWS